MSRIRRHKSTQTHYTFLLNEKATLIVKNTDIMRTPTNYTLILTVACLSQLVALSIALRQLATKRDNTLTHHNPTRRGHFIS